jgi:transcriptional regulator with XRE-family HTH domain
MSTPLITKLRSWREAKGLSLAEVSDLTGYSEAMLSRAERGERAFSPMARVLIARRLGIAIAELFDPDEAPGTEA